MKCREFAEREGLIRVDIANREVLEKRRLKGLHKYVNLYISPRNAMMYILKKSNVVILGISGEVVKREGVRVSIGNAASEYAVIRNFADVYIDRLIREVRKIRDWTLGEIQQIDVKSFLKREPINLFINPKVLLQSEILIPRIVGKKYIRAIYVPDDDTKGIVREIIDKAGVRIDIIVQPNMFFLPQRKVKIYKNIWVVKGDLFDSEMQTLTISVNTVGVMGKGLASRLKYLYPSAYVAYQDYVKSGVLKPGRPVVYRMIGDNDYIKWFLFFPTKRHWREKSEISMIEEGLRWFVKNYKKEGIESVAFPALGCGLGGLKWEDVGPLMVKYLKYVDIEVELYVQGDEEEYFKPEFYGLHADGDIEG